MLQRQYSNLYGESINLGPSRLILTCTFKWYHLYTILRSGKAFNVRVEFLLLLLFPCKKKNFLEWNNYIPSTKIALKTKVKQA